MKKHEVKLSIVLHKVNLSVKFPCKLSVTIKTQAHQQQIATQVPLQNGQAVIQSEYVTQFSTEFNSRTSVYREKKIMLIVYLKSSSGRIPAGNITMDLNSLKKGTNKIETNILKCPDNVTLQVQKEQDAQKEIDLDTKSKSSYRDSYESPRSLQQVNRANGYSTRDLNASKLSVQNEKKPYQYRQNTHKLPVRSPISNYVRRCEEQTTSQREKIGKMERERQTSKQTRSIKYSVAGRERQREKQEGSREKIKVLQKQIESQNDKMSQIELQLTKKNYKQNQLHRDKQLIHRKYDRLLVELTTEKSKREAFEKSSREFEQQLKIIKDKVQDLQLTNQNLLKKMEFKQNVLKQQLRVMTDRFSSSQADKQRMLIQKNDLIIDFEEKQRALRLAFKEKEKAWNEDKTKFFKDIESLHNSMQLLEHSNQDKQSEMNQMQLKNALITRQREQLQRELQNMKDQLIQQRIRYQQELETKAQSQLLQQQVKRLQGQLKKAKKFLGERQQQILRLEQANVNSKSLNQKLAKKLEETEHSLKEKTAQNKILQREYESATKELQKIKKESLQISQKVQDITFANHNKTSQFAALNQQLHQRDKTYQDQIYHLNQQLTKKDQQVNELLIQLQEMTEHETSIGNQLLHLQNQIQQMTTQVNHKFIENENLKAQLEELINNNDSLGKQAQRQAEKIVELDKLVSQGQLSKHAQLMRSQSKINELQRRLQSFTETSTSEILVWNGRIQKLQQLVLQKEEQLKSYRTQNTDLQTEIIQRDANYSEVQHQLKLKLNQIQFLKQQLTQSRKDLTEKDSQAKTLSITLEHTEQQLFISNQKLQTLTAQVLSLQHASSAASTQLQQYQATTLHCLKHFFALINSQEELQEDAIPTQQQLQLLKHDKSEQISKAILESLHNKNTYISKVNKQFKKYDQTLSQMKHNHQQLTKSKQTLSLELQALIDQRRRLQKELSLGSNDIKQLKEESQVQKKALQCQISSLFNQKQSLNLQMSDLRTQLEKQTELRQQTQTLLQQHKVQIKNLNLQALQQSETQLLSITELKQQLQGKDKLLQTKDTQLQRLIGVIQTQKKQIEEFQTKYCQSMSSLQNQRRQIKNLARQVQDKKTQNLKLLTEIDRLKQQAQQINKTSSSKLQQTQQELKNQIKSLQQQNLSLKESNQSLTKTTQSLQQKQRQLQTQSNHLKSSLQQQIDKAGEQLKLINQHKNEILKQKTQITQLRQANYSLQTNKNKLTKDNQAISKVRKTTDQQIQRHKQVIQSQKSTIQKLTDRIKDDDKTKKQLQQQLKQSRKDSQAKSRQVQAKSNNLKTLQFLKQTEYRKVSNQLEQFKQTNKKLLAQNTQHHSKLKDFETRINLLNKQLETTQKKNSIEANTLKPIKALLVDIKAILTLQLKSFQNFQNGKNKLLKTSTQKLDGYTDKSYADFVRELSTALNQLKVSVLSKFSDVKSKEKIISQFSTLNSLLTKWNWGGFA